jgi:hypothetical protein
VVSSDRSDNRNAWLPIALTLMALMTGLSAPARAQIGGRLIDVIDADRREDHVNLTIQFSCTMRYISHLPATAGTETLVRFRPGADCGLGQVFSGINELPSIAAADEFLKALRVEDGAPGEINLVLGWRKPTTYVVAPTGDQRGFVVRIIEAPPKGKITIQETFQAPTLFSVNLDSRTKPFTAAEMAAVAAQFGLSAYVSTIVLDGVTWHRLRVGPIAARADADRLLLLAQSNFPRAWLAIGEDEDMAGGDGGARMPPAAPLNPDPPLPDADRAKILGGAKDALAARDYNRAVELLTTLVRQPEYPDRAAAQELLGLARERSGQLAHAKAEYEEYLRRYPHGEAAERVRVRLKTLALAGRKPRSQSAAGNESRLGWTYSGGAAQLYRWDHNAITTGGLSFDQTSQNAVISNADFLARRRGERFDFLGRTYLGDVRNFVSGAGGDQTQINAAFIELNDKKLNLSGRFGRQSRGSDGIFGTFDGASVAYRIEPRVTINATFGYPVDTVTDGVRTNREFAGVSANFGTFAQSWDFSTYAIEQKYNGQVDRRAVGLETRYFRPGRSLITLLDYDTFFKTLNSATIIGGLTLPGSWTASFNFDRRQSPILTLRNALIGQPVTTIADLSVNFTPAEIMQLARDRTAMSDVFAITLTRPLGQRFQFSTDYYLTKVGATPPSGNVPGTPASGSDRALQMQIFGTSLWRAGDLHVLSLRYEQSEFSKSETLGLSSRVPLWQNWRIGPRLQIENIRYTSDQSTELGYVPSVRLEYLRSRALFEFEAGGDFGRREMQIPLDTQNTKRYYFSLGYRVGF